jgi:hypothetical protein
MSNTYVHKPWKVAAIQWTGDNFAAVEQFARDWLGDLDEIGLRNDRDDDFNMVQFYAWNDDQEVDPGYWIVVDREAEDRGKIMHADDFRIAYEAEVSGV